MNFHSLRLRLLAFAGLSILLALAVAGFGQTYLFERHIEQREALSLEAKAVELLGGLRLDVQGRPVADIYPSDNRFSRPAGGLYWQVSTPRGSIHSPSLWDQSLDRPTKAPSADWATRRAAGPYGHGVIIVERIVRPDKTDRDVLVQLAADDDALVVARQEFRRELLASMAFLWIVLMLAAYFQVRLGLLPLARIPDELGRLRRNPGARLPSAELAEVRPLFTAINALAEARGADLARARTRASDLAHSLKTPLAAISAQSRRAREAGASDAADGIDRAVAATGAALEGELARSRAALSRDADKSATTNVFDVVEGVVAVLERTDAGERIVFDVSIPTDLVVPVVQIDLTEILGALAENAVRHANRRVRIDGFAGPDHVSLEISDDGPGLSEEGLLSATTRGVRLDESGAGHGLGLAIVRDHVEATDGELLFSNGALGGLSALMRWERPEQ